MYRGSYWSAFPSKGNEKDIAQETPDFIGGFAFSSGDFSKCQIIDVKSPFSLCG